MPLSPQLLLLAMSSEEKVPPVIDIDGTVLIQFGLFLVMYFVLKHMFFEPYLAMRKQRSAGIEGAREEAERMEARAKELEREHERRFQSARAKAEEERLRLRGEGQARERELLTEARGVASAKLAAARKQIDAETQAASIELQQKAQPLARQIASKILGREVRP